MGLSNQLSALCRVLHAYHPLETRDDGPLSWNITIRVDCLKEKLFAMSSGAATGLIEDTLLHCCSGSIGGLIGGGMIRSIFSQKIIFNVALSSQNRDLRRCMQVVMKTIHHVLNQSSKFTCEIEQKPLKHFTPNDITFVAVAKKIEKICALQASYFDHHARSAENWKRCWQTVGEQVKKQRIRQLTFLITILTQGFLKRRIKSHTYFERLRILQRMQMDDNSETEGRDREQRPSFLIENARNRNA
ncbi:MAG: hypothetical protein WB791_07670 [Waddliaceae bacterium]